MKIDPIGGGDYLPLKARGADASKDTRIRPADATELGRSTPAAKGTTESTYSRADIVATPAAGDNEHVENRMTSDARASRLATIEKQVGQGAYNAREIIERVADRLLDEWGLGTHSHKPRSE